MNIESYNQFKKIQGVALLEVLVAVLVFSIGLLGLAGLQTTSLKFTANAYQVSRFNEVAYDIADRVRANIDGARLGGFLIDISDTNPTHSPLPCPGYYQTQDPIFCSRYANATTSVQQWGTTSFTTHLNGQWSAAVTCTDADNTDPDPCTLGSIYNIRLTWDEKAVGGKRSDNKKAWEESLGEATDKAGDGLITREISISFRPGRGM